MWAAAAQSGLATMITPTRFGIKYAPVPTLALEYEDDASAVDGDGHMSLYVLREDEPRRRVKKLHVVELPMLTKASETGQILERLQRDNSKFLSPSVVNETQLKRLLDLLVERLETGGSAADPPPQRADTPASTFPSLKPTRALEAENDEVEQEKDVEESFIEESMAESSQALESSGAPSEHEQASRPVAQLAPAPNRGTFLSQVEENEDEQEASAVRKDNGEVEQNRSPASGEHDGDDDYTDERYDGPDKASGTSNAATSQSAVATAAAFEKHQDEKDDKEKKKAPKSESEMSEEDVQSEELEYFSEDGSDEDSF